MNLSGKVLLITGGARGIGLDTAQRVHAAGARMVMVDVGIAYFGFIDTKLVRDAFDRPGITELRSSFPGFLATSIPVGRAGTAMVEGIQRRAPRITAPGWMRATLPLRGLLHYLDGRMVRDRKVQRGVDAAERATTDADD